MKKILAMLLLCALLLGSANGLASAAVPTVSFQGSDAEGNGRGGYSLQLRADAAFDRDTDVQVTCLETGARYTVSFAAGSTYAETLIPLETVSKKTLMTFVLQAGEGYAAAPAKSGGSFKLQLYPLPKVEFYLDASIGFVGRDMNVIVTCKNPSSVVGSHTFQLRDQTGRLYQEKEWKNPSNRLTFSFPVTEDMEGGKYFSVWWNGIRVSEVNAGYGAITNAKRSIIRSVDTTDPYMAITIDCCYDDHQTDAILAVLDEYNVKCTFFMAGYFVRTFTESAKKIVAAGHEIGNHTNTHPRMTQLESVHNQIRQIMKPTEDIEAILGVRVRLYRPPFGDHDQRITALARGEGQEVVMWSIDSHDWDEKFKRDPEKVLERDKHNVGPGTVVLHHLDGFNAPAILRQIIPYYQNELGLTLVPISELMAHAGRVVPDLREPDNLFELPEGMD